MYDTLTGEDDMLFNVVDTETDEVLRAYDTGKRAGAVSGRYNRLASAAGIERRVRVVKDADGDDAWKTREAARFITGEYERLPWYAPAFPWDNVFVEKTLDEWGATFPHVSTDDPTKIAYTPDATYGVQDRQSRTTPGRFLRLFFPPSVMSDSRVEQLSAKLLARGTYHLADTREDIAEVYMRGPRSCMSHETGEFRSYPVHPTEVYAAGDLAIAHTKAAGDILARAIVWPERQIYGRVYGQGSADIDRLTELLQNDGYSDGSMHEWEGAKLLRIETNEGKIVMPYLDVHHNFGEHPDGVHLQIGGDQSADSADGVAYGVERCTECARIIDTDYDSYVHDADGNLFCMGCRASCWDCDEAAEHDSVRAGAYGDEYLCPTCATGHETCDLCSRLTVDYAETKAGHLFCHEAGCADDETFLCEACDEIIRNDGMSDAEHPHGYVCTECADDGDYETPAVRTLHPPRDMPHHEQLEIPADHTTLRGTI